MTEEQAVSKWENEVTTPDIQLLPEIAVYFGVTIDELFKIPNEAHIERIEKMIESTNDITDEMFESSREFLEGCIKHEKAIKLWDMALEEEKDNWHASFLRAERALKLCSYNEAIKYYERALALQQKPKFTDPIIAMAQIYELLGNYQEAILCREKEIEILKDDYKIVSGEMVEKPLREIKRLRSI